MGTKEHRHLNRAAKKVFIHIGWHKTGSSSLQVALSKASALPFLYPRAGRERVWQGAHHDLTLPGHLAETCAALKREIDDAEDDCVLISCEDLSRPLSLPTLIRLCETLSAHDVELVAVIRRHDHYFESLYAEEVKRGRTVLRCWEFFNHNPGLLDFLDMVRLIEDATGLTCRLLPYQNDLSPARLAETITGRPTRLNESFRHNVSLPPLFTEAIRFIRASNNRAFEERHVAYAYEFIKAQNPKILRNINTFNCFLSHKERRSIFEFKLRENFELGTLFNGAAGLWWDLEHTARGRPVPQDNPVALLLDLLVYRDLSDEWRE